MNNPALSAAVQAAIGRRAMGAPVPQLSQVSPQAPMASGTPPQPLPMSSMTKSSAIPAPKKSGSLSYAPQNQSDQIVSALIETLKANGKLDSEKLKLASGQSIQSPAPAVPSFNQTPPQNSGNVFGAPSMAVSSMQGGNPLSAGPF